MYIDGLYIDVLNIEIMVTDSWVLVEVAIEETVPTKWEIICRFLTSERGRNRRPLHHRCVMLRIW